MNTTELAIMGAAIYFLCCRNNQNSASMGKINNPYMKPPRVRNIYRMAYAGAAGLGRAPFASEGRPPRNAPFFRNSPSRFPGVAGGFLPQGSSPFAEMAYNKPPSYYWKQRVKSTPYNGYGRSLFPRYYSVSKLTI